ncbi:MAG: hypothetical protein Unbinned5079contig1000_41 [Prokaryotic dsDNA virus sp.]|nr:MAG: hypothetical protein Unbinned5079contig1000_41 [Prokaryotic dsDNA virus sp.]|tara:strand:- start:10266 stop:10688 length:423 start_codon:yes stop_codon:yes gene_type:complete
MPNIIKFEKEHLSKINLAFELTQSGKDSLSSYDDVIGYTGMDKDVILAIGGVHQMWNGVGEAWILVAKEGYKIPKTIAKYTDYLFQHIQETHELSRIQASVCASDVRANRYAQWLGFEKEGIMRKYGPDGTDYIRYARVI